MVGGLFVTDVADDDLNKVVAPPEVVDGVVTLGLRRLRL